MQKLYIIVRNDITPGLQIAQSCHALREFVAAYPELDREWHHNHRNIVVLQAATLGMLEGIRDDAKARELPCAEFREPDLDEQLTAIALGAGASKMVSGLPLALR